MHALTSQRRTAEAVWWSPAFGLGTAVTVAVVAVGLAATGWSTLAVLTAVTLSPAAIAAAVDSRTGRLPDQLVLITAMPSMAVVVHESVDGRAASTVPAAVLGVLVFAAPLLVVHLVAPDALGFGDVKLAAALGLTIGLVDWRFGLTALLAATGTTALVGLTTGRRELPLGPGLVLGAAVALALAAQTGAVVLLWR